MAQLKSHEIIRIQNILKADGGYVLDFSNKTFLEYFKNNFGIAIYDEKYSSNGPSKWNRLKTFISIEDDNKVAEILSSLWEYRRFIVNEEDTSINNSFKNEYFSIIDKLKKNHSMTAIDNLDLFIDDKALEELVTSIKRDISAGKPQAALDRLHTYCMKYFAHLLNKRNIDYNQLDPLNSRVGKYIKSIKMERHKISITIIKSSISIFSEFNDVRNNRSFAHDNDLLDLPEADFIFKSICNILRFIKSLEAKFDIAEKK